MGKSCNVAQIIVMWNWKFCDWKKRMNNKFIFVCINGFGIFIMWAVCGLDCKVSHLIFKPCVL